MATSTIPYLLLSLLTTSIAAVEITNQCPDPQVHRFLDFSQARIQKSKQLEFNIDLINSSITEVKRIEQGLLLSGNFSRLRLRNPQTRKETLYDGLEMLVKIPPNHVFNLQKIPKLQIQINHVAVKIEDNNPFRFVIFSQLYETSKFTNKIEIKLSQYLHRGLKKGDQIPTAKLMKIISGFPILMYRGVPESYPCRSDLLVLLKREYQLISEPDFQQLTKIVQTRSQTKLPKKAFRRKNVYEVYPIKPPKNQIVNEEL